MNIQWFPGHMTKALRMMEDNIKLVDIVGYVLDARAPYSCLNPAFEKLINNKPCLFILNKADLADPAQTTMWQQYFTNKGYECIATSATDLSHGAKIVTALGKLSKDINAKYKAKGIFRPVRAMIIGVPNCGKSTIINCLCGKKTAITGDKPGVTRGKQWVRLANGIELLDTPGTVWSKFEQEEVGRHLCFIGSIKDDVVDLYEVSLALLEELSHTYPQLIVDRYGSEVLDSNAETMHQLIAKRRGFVMRGGVVDTERCSKAIMDDFRKGKLGRITLDSLPAKAQ